MSDYENNALLADARNTDEEDLIGYQGEAATEREPSTFPDSIETADEDYFGSVRERIESENKELAWAFGSHDDREWDRERSDEAMEVGVKGGMAKKRNRNRHYHSDTSSEATAALLASSSIGKRPRRRRTRTGSGAEREKNAFYQKQHRAKEKERREEMSRRVEELEKKVETLEDHVDNLTVENDVLKCLLAQHDGEVAKLKAQIAAMEGRLSSAVSNEALTP